ncbi:hypothetical protein [Streptomyces sp. NPDC058441]|uniref:hypothetical protein n=1 Tax=Streptomyces sp. NPDC058441 TaxID=3346502 RepID=UPI00365993AD
MQVKRTKHTSGFTVLPNAILQHSELSLTARGLLCLLLSQPEHTAETIKSLTADVAEGNARVTKATKELQAAGYIVVTNHQNERGHWSKAVAVYDVPQAVAPKDETPKAGRLRARISGLEPLRGKNQEKNPPVPQPSVAVEDMGRGEEAPQQSEEIGRAAAALGRLSDAVPSLKLSASDVLKLAPVAAEWLARGASELQLRNELTEGLPATIKSPRALLADRLTRKMPPVPVVVEKLTECGECGTYLPRGQKAGICSQCAGVAPAASEPTPVGQSDEAASLLDAIRQRRSAGTVKGSRRGFATA